MTNQETLRKMNSMLADTLMETLDINFTEIGSDFLTATMPVNSRVHQPMGLLHGGATVALAETVASSAAHLFVGDPSKEVRGIEITANHLKSKRDGLVTATARPIHKGRTTQLWEVRVTDEEGNLISLCKMTCIILSKS
jgi:uncharacterized protein (TIGR00369 family)